MRAQVVCVVIATLLCAPALQAQNTELAPATERLDQLQTTLRKARAGSDWPSYLATARQMKDLLNASPASQLELARAETHAGHIDAALDELAAYARTGQASEVIETLADFEPLRRSQKFDHVRTVMATNRRPVARATVAFRISDERLVPEDIDFDPRSRRFFLSSVLQHRIVSTTGDGALARFANAPDDWPVLALKIDTKRQVLWATEVALNRGRSAVLSYDLNTARLLQRIEGPPGSALGDMALAADGSVVVSDGEHGGVYRLEPGKDSLERLDQGDFISPQTVALAPDSTHVYVPDYLRGLGLLDFKTKRVQWLSTNGVFALAGIDGLYCAGNKLLAVQNGASPERVMLFSMDATGRKIVGQQVIERATGTLGDPTHGVIVGDTFYYIANAGWESLDAEGTAKPGATMTPSLVMKWRLTNP